MLTQSFWHNWGCILLNTLILSLIIFPLIFTLLFLVWNNKVYYKVLSILMAVAGAFFSLLLIFKGPFLYQTPSDSYHVFEPMVLILEILILGFLYFVSIKHKRWKVLALTILSTAFFLYKEFAASPEAAYSFNVDNLSIVMLFIINVVGTLIVVFSNGYIGHYEEHRNLKNKQRLYYGIIGIFLSAMNGLVICDSLSLMFLFWEITTLCSFLLISYNRDEEAYNSGFRALFLNLIGGAAFALGNIILSSYYNIDSFTGILQSSKGGGFYFIPIFLLCIAGFTKSAQLPFQSWLLGAMVAPTPISALLHSSTMVKAGVYLIVKLSPAYAGTPLGVVIAILGAFSFLICSALAISQRNAKRVLAYSTIANLGLIISSAGMGSSLAISAALILIIFHAISKALLFLCAGEIEHTIGSRDIEEMSGLVHKAPLLAIIAAFAMASMILPPFGVLITKWMAIEASAHNPFISVFLILGSAFTTVFWVKWLGTILSYPNDDNVVKTSMKPIISIPLLILSSLVVLTSVFMSRIFNHFVDPEVSALLNVKNELAMKNGMVISQLGSFNDTIVFIIIILSILIFLALKGIYGKKARVVKPYMCGENNSENGDYSFRCVDGSIKRASVANIYLYKIIDESSLITVGYIVSIAILLLTLIGGLIWK